jgi:hypothetical protein
LPSDVVDPPSFTAGNSSGGAPKKKKALIGVGIGGAAILAYFLIKRSSSSTAATTTTTSPQTILQATPANAADDSGSQDADTSAQYTALMNSLQALPGTLSTNAANAQTGLETTISGNQATLLAAIQANQAAASPAASTPAVSPKYSDPYSIGQVVNSATGEKVVATVNDASGLGSYAETNIGGIYTAGNAQIGSNYGGSYLGYAATSPANNPTNGTGLGNFSNGSLTLNADGSYTETDSTGHAYTFKVS